MSSMSPGEAKRTGAVTFGFFSLVPIGAAVGAMVMPVLLTLAGLLCIRPREMRADLSRIPGPLWVLLVFALWASLSSAWSPYHNHGQAFRFLATLAPGLLFIAATTRDAASRRWVRSAGLAAILVLMALLAFEAVFNMPLNRAFNHQATWLVERNPGRGVSLLLAMVWAGAGVLWTTGGARRWLAAALLAVAAALAPQFEDYGNLAGYAAGLVGFLLGACLPRLATLAVTWSLGAWLLLAPLLAPILLSSQRIVDLLPYSWAARAGIWRYVSARIAEHPIFGSGMDASHSVTDTIVVRGVTMRAIQLHPHNGSLHVWYDTGGVGAVILAIALFWGGWAMSRALAGRRAYAAAVCGTFAALGTIANISYGVWQEWWDATLLIGACMLTTMAANHDAQIGTRNLDA